MMMTNTQKTILKIVGGLVITYFAITAIASTGTVIDEKGKPIKGAHIAAYWNGNAGLFVQTTARCYHSESTTSDDKGHFGVSTFSGNLNPLMFDRQRSIDVFVPGYELTPASNYDDLKFIVTALTGTKSEQFQKVNSSYKEGRCGGDIGQLAFIKAVYNELTKLADTSEEKKLCDSRWSGIEYVEFGYEGAKKRARERSAVAEKKERRPNLIIFKSESGRDIKETKKIDPSPLVPN